MNSSLNRIDAALQGATPTFMVPRHEPFIPMEKPGHRFLAARDGLWLEARRAWLYLCHPLAYQPFVPMPYGDLTPVIEVQSIPPGLVAEFLAVAKRAAPAECAAWIVWNSATGVRRLQHMIATTGTAQTVEFSRPRLDDDEHLLLDIHSHGDASAYFSGKDDLDDMGEFKLSGVLGRVNDRVEMAFRLCANGLYIRLGNQRDGLSELFG